MQERLKLRTVVDSDESGTEDKGDRKNSNQNLKTKTIMHIDESQSFVKDSMS